MNKPTLKINEKEYYWYLFGRWLGDGSKTTPSLCIACDIENSKFFIEKTATFLNTTWKRMKHNVIVLFKNTYELVIEYKEMLAEIDEDSLKLEDERMYLILAGFLDSDGSVDYPGPKKEEYLQGIKIGLYNNNLHIINFLNNFLTKEKMAPILKKPRYNITNYGVEDKCYRININKSLDIYYICNKVKKHILHSKKKRRIEKWLKEFDNLYQNKKLKFTEIFKSIEGEGRDMGKPKIFARVKGCPFNCSFCDSKYSIGDKTYGDGDKIKKTINKIEKLMVGGVNHIEFTGGSPDWYPNVIGYLLIYFKTHYNSRITMQISGGLYTPGGKNLYRLSDINSFDYKDPRENIPFIIEKNSIREQDEIKFLIKDEISYNFAKDKITELLEKGLKCEFGITTVTNNDDKNISLNHLKSYKKILERILKDDTFPKQNIRIFPRLHILLYKHKKGV